MHLRPSADARHKRSDTAVSQDAERSWLWVRGDITWKSYMNPVIRRQTCLCAVPQGLSDMETSSQLKQNRKINRGRAKFLVWLVAQDFCLFQTWLDEVKLRLMQWDTDRNEAPLRPPGICFHLLLLTCLTFFFFAAAWVEELSWIFGAKEVGSSENKRISPYLA